MFGKIYKIENMINHKIYIGQTILDDVIKDRYGGSIKHTHNNHLKDSINLYGEDNFDVSIIDYAENKDELNKKEIYWISYYDSYKNGYNETQGGQYGLQTQEAIEKMKKSISIYWDKHSEKKKEISEKYSGDNNPLVLAGGHTGEDKEKMRRIRLKMMQSNDNNIDLEKARKLSLTPENKRKQVISSSKYWIVMYDIDFNEIKRWHTLKDMYDFMVENNYDTHYKNYRSFKQPAVQNKIFNNNLYKEEYGFIFKKILKTDSEKRKIRKDIRQKILTC